MRLELKGPAAASVARGHPWVYREALARPPRALASLPSGEIVDLVDPSGAFVGRGLWDASSPIAVRVYERHDKARLDEAAMARRLERAFAFRDRLFAPSPGESAADTDAYRLCHGEGDLVPGLVLDRYAHVAVARTDGEAMERWLPRLVPKILRALVPRGVRSLALRLGEADAAGSKLAPLAGEAPPPRVWVEERGMRMEVDLARGQKTGAFLDQRDNRARVRVLARGRRSVLNLFSYAGGFSLAAALGGATRVTSVDVAAGAHASAQRSFRENGLDPSAHAFVTADVFTFLDAARARGERFELVVCDPPSFAPSERAKARALAAYARLHAAALSVLAEGGTFCAASCSSHVSMEDFLATLEGSTLAGLSVRGAFGSPADHPSLATFPEGRYLKFVVLE